MHIVHLTNSLAKEDGGPALMCRRLAKRQGVRGHKVTIVSPDGASQAEGVRIDPREHKVDIRLARRWRASLAPGMFRLLPKSPNVVHLHGLFGSAAHMALHYAQRGVPVIVRPCGMLEHDSLTLGKSKAKRAHVAAIESPLVQAARFLHVTSEQEKEKLAQEKWKARARVIPLAIDVAALKPERKPLQNRLVFYSRLHEKKRPSWVLDYLVHNKSASLSFCGAGTPHIEEALREKTKSLALSERVEFLGHVDALKRNAVMDSAHAMVLPSKTENFAQVVVEAWGRALGVVMCEGVALSRMAKESGVGFVASDDKNDFFKALDRYLALSKAERDLHEEKAFGLSQQFAWPHFLNALDALYKEACA